MVQFQMYFLWDWHVIKHSYDTNDYITKKNNSVIIYIVFSLVPRRVFLLSKNTSIFNVNYPRRYSYVYFSVVQQAVKKLNQTSAIKCKTKLFSRDILDSEF